MDVILNNFITQILSATDKVVYAFVENSYKHLVSSNIDIFTSLLVIFVVLTGLRGMYHGFTASDIFMPIIKMVIIYTFATRWNYFHDYIYNFLTSVPNAIIGAFSDVGDGKYGLNTVVIKGFKLVTELFAEATFGTWYFYFLAIAVLIVNMIAMVAGLGGILVAKLLLAIYLFMAPVFIMLFLFDVTKPMVESWVQQLITMTLWPILICAILLMMLMISEEIMFKDFKFSMEKNGAVTLVFEFLIFQGLTAFLLTQVPSKAAALAGGVMLSGYRGAVQSSREFKNNSLHALSSLNKMGAKITGRSSIEAVKKGATASSKAQASKKVRNIANRLHA